MKKMAAISGRFQRDFKAGVAPIVLLFLVLYQSRGVGCYAGRTELNMGSGDSSLR